MRNGLLKFGMIGIPPSVTAAMVRIHGAAGSQWIDALPVRVEECVQRWSLSLQQAMWSVGGAVVHARCPNGEAVTLKLVIDAVAYESERAALAGR